MIDLFNPPQTTNRAQQEWLVLFSIAVANKPAQATQAKLRRFLGEQPLPFETVRALLACGGLETALHVARLSPYKKLSRAFQEAIDLDLDALAAASPEDALVMLTGVHGIGPKTARL